MKELLRHYLFILIIPFAVLFCCCSPRRSEPIRGKLSIKDERVDNGRKVYMTYCQKCHPHGEAGLGPAINSNPAPQFVKRFQVRHGLGVMPSFKRDEISRSDLKDLSRYMKALKHH